MGKITVFKISIATKLLNKKADNLRYFKKKWNYGGKLEDNPNSPTYFSIQEMVKIILHGKEGTGPVKGGQEISLPDDYENYFHEYIKKQNKEDLLKFGLEVNEEMYLKL